MTAALILLIIAIICLFLAAVPAIIPTDKISVGWLGLFFWALSQVVK